jgi:hypothetical protein
MRVLIACLVIMLSMSMAVAAKKKPTPSSCRDARTGRYVTASYGDRYPGLTVCETRPPKR